MKVKLNFVYKSGALSWNFLLFIFRVFIFWVSLLGWIKSFLYFIIFKSSFFLAWLCNYNDIFCEKFFKGETFIYYRSPIFYYVKVKMSDFFKVIISKPWVSNSAKIRIASKPVETREDFFSLWNYSRSGFVSHFLNLANGSFI